MGTTEHEEPRFFFILNKGCEVRRRNHPCRLKTVLSFRSRQAGTPFMGLHWKEKLSSEEIQQQMKELGVEMEIVPLI